MILHVLYADNHIVAASPNQGAINYCFDALTLEARHEVRRESVEFAERYPVIQYIVVPPLKPEDLGGPDDPIPDIPGVKNRTVYETIVTTNLVDCVNIMREVIHDRIVIPFDTGK